MSILDRILAPVKRTSHEAEGPVTTSDPGWLERWFAGLGGQSVTGITINTETALQVPAVWAAVNFLSGTLAGLPLKVYTTTKGVRKLKTGAVADLLAGAVNDEMSSFEWRKTMFDEVFTAGRSYTYIERNGAGNAVNFFPMDGSRTTAVRQGGRKFYETRNQLGEPVLYPAADVIDIPFMLMPDRLSHRSPIGRGAEAIGLAIASMRYGAKIFKKGGMPPLVMQGPFQTEAAMQRASDQLIDAMAKAYEDGRQAIALPIGHEAKPLGFEPEKMQLVELQRWCVEQVARIYSLPPTFLQDLSNGTHSNTEQQDLHFVKHTLKRWIEQVEQELNLKLFGRGNRRTFVEFGVDGLLRGDFKTRYEGYSSAIQNGHMTPNEVREIENREPLEGGDVAYIQGGTVPLAKQAQAPLGHNGGPPIDDDD